VSWIWLAALRAVSSADLQVAYGTGFSLWCPAVVFAAGLVAVLPRSPNGVEALPQHPGRASARWERESAAGGVEIACRAGALVFVPGRIKLRPGRASAGKLPRDHGGVGLPDVGPCTWGPIHLPLSRCALERKSAAHGFESLSSAGKRVREPGERAHPGRVLDAGWTQGSLPSRAPNSGIHRKKAKPRVGTAQANAPPAGRRR
jgi:hypothetical protein